MAHKGRCKVCGTPISISSCLSGNNDSVKMAVPFLLWLFPIPILSAVLMKEAGPNFCGDACKQAWRQQHPLGWLWVLILSHIIAPALLVGFFWLLGNAPR